MLYLPGPPSGKDNKVAAAKDKICEDFNKNDCKFSSDHVGAGPIWKHSCAYCFKEVDSGPGQGQGKVNY